MATPLRRVLRQICGVPLECVPLWNGSATLCTLSRGPRLSTCGEGGCQHINAHPVPLPNWIPIVDKCPKWVLNGGFFLRIVGVLWIGVVSDVFLRLRHAKVNPPPPYKNTQSK